MSNHRYCIITNDGAREFVDAPSLRTAVRNFEADKSKPPIVAAIESGCLPAQPAADRPFVAVFLRNPAFATEGQE